MLRKACAQFDSSRHGRPAVSASPVRRYEGAAEVAMVTAASRAQVLSLYRRVLRIGRSWRAQNEHETEKERKYISEEARNLFRQNQQLTDRESIQRCVSECEARIEIGLHYRNPYPRPLYLPPMGLATQKGRKLRAQQRLRKQAKPVYLQSHDET